MQSPFETAWLLLKGDFEDTQKKNKRLHLIRIAPDWVYTNLLDYLEPDEIELFEELHGRVEELPDESVAVQVTVVSPTGKNSGASLVIDATFIMSYAVASPNSITLLDKSVASPTMSEGAETSGAVVSIIVTTWVACEVLPEVSVTVQVTVVLPN